MLLQERYRLLKLIGKGGCCKTYLAVDEVQFPPVPCVIQEFLWQNETLKLFEQKAQWLEELGQHPQIPALLAYFQQEQHFYFVQELIAGSNLAQVVAEEGTFNETQIWQLLENILPVLKFISDRHIIHRDIKPENLIRVAENLILVDFSAAKLITELDQFTDNNIGSPEYVAPEQARGKTVFASDLYSLGVTCIYLLTQIPPFDLFDIANDCWVWQQYLTTRVSDRLSKILTKLLQNNVNQRFQSADEVMEAMGMESKITNFQLPIPPWQCLHTLRGNLGSLSSVNTLGISSDNKILASGSNDKIIRLWDLDTKKFLAALSGHSQAITSIAFSPDGKTLATASDDKTIKLWHLNTFEEIFTLTGHSHTVKSVAFHPDGQILASGSWDKKIKLWDVNTGIEICTLTGHKLQITSVAFSPQGKLLASASFDRTIRLWQLTTIEASDTKLHSEITSPNEQTTVNNSLSPSLLSSTSPDHKKSPNHSCTLLGTLSGHTGAVLTVAFSPDGKILATGSDDNTIRLCNVNTGQLVSTLLGHFWSVVALAFTADGETLISGSWDKTVKLWQVSTATEITTLSGHEDSVSAVAVSQVTQLIATASRDTYIRLWQLVQ